MGGGELLVNIPSNFNECNEHELTRKVFRHLKDEVLEGRTVAKILRNKKRQEQLINRVLGTASLPYD